MTPTTIQLIGTVLFAVAILHTFATAFFEHMAHTRPVHAGLWHLLGEVEVVFGFWALVLIAAMFLTDGAAEATRYLDSRNFTEPMFVFAIMVIAGTRPVLHTALTAVRLFSQAMPLPHNMSFYLIVLTLVPLLGSFITEPAPSACHHQHRRCGEGGESAADRDIHEEHAECCVLEACREAVAEKSVSEDQGGNAAGIH